MKKEDKKKIKKEKNKKEEDYSIRSINLKLHPTQEHAELMDIDFTKFSNLFDIGVNRYAKLKSKKIPIDDMIKDEAKKMREKLKSPECSGTFVDLAVGKKGAESHFRSLRKTAKADILHRDKEIKKIEKDNKDLIKLKSVWFSSIKKKEGICSMCGRNGNLFWKSNEYDEYLCEVCIVDFFVYRETLKPINRKLQKNYFLCHDLASDDNLSKGLRKEIKRQLALLEKYNFKNTISNKIKLKGGQLKMDFETKMSIITLSNLEKIQVPFSGDYYYTNFPRYGLNSENLKFQKLINDFLGGKGYAFLIRKFKDGNPEYFLSIPTHYPMVNKELKVEYIEGCILVSQRKVLIYINGKAKFIELFNPYIKKRIYGIKNKDIQNKNKELCICDWNRIPKKNHMLLVNLKKKLGFDWINEHEITVTKSEDGNSITIKDDNDDKKMIEISINRDTGFGELRSEYNGSHILRELYIVERQKKPEIVEEENRYRKTDIYLEPKIPMSKKYSGGSLLRHIRHKNKETARHIVEEAKKMLSDKGSVVLIDYKGMHPEGEGEVPMGALNDQINNMLKYDSIYGGSIYWKHLLVLTCPNCHKDLPERRARRYIIRDIFLSDIIDWVCEDNICNTKINSPLIAVARHIMNSDMEKLLKKPKKEKENNENDNENENDEKIRYNQYSQLKLSQPAIIEFHEKVNNDPDIIKN